MCSDLPLPSPSRSPSAHWLSRSEADAEVLSLTPQPGTRGTAAAAEGLEMPQAC